ncbi:uncharacterized protein [Gossypium hirsutum]|uniref:Retrotransposon gag domain-containing protein n=1 Tax=Gossypium hirsutum TaxID=3635 RepID=A0A1U8NVL9_GOSHI|nr:uncharacterized protein LOC107952276 [Gossypium hirsutum]
MASSLDDYLVCVVSLLKEEAYNWWETIEAVVLAGKINWEFFQNEFKKKYVSKRYLDKKKREFLDLRQGNKSVDEYEKEFVYLSKYARDIVPTEEEMCIRFKEGLNNEIRMMIGGTEIQEFIVLTDPLPIKKSKEEFSRATSALERSGKSRPRQSNYKASDRPAVSVGSVQNTQRPKCQHYGRSHSGECRTPPKKGRRSGQSSATGATHSGMKDTASRSEVRAPARTYAIREREEATALDVIAVKGYDFPADLMLLPFREFDIILRMDWLMKHDMVVNCREKRISLKFQTGDIILVESGNLDDTIRMISSISAQKLLRKGNEAYLAYIFDTRSSKSKLEQLSIVNEFMDVFPEELPGLPPDRKVELVIDVLPGTAPISMTSYRMAPGELKELKTQLQKLLDKGFIRPSMSPWGAPILFVKKE